MLQHSGWLFFRLLINKYSPARLDTLSKLMPKEEYDQLAEIQLSQKIPNVLLFEPNEWLHLGDYSWLESTFCLLPAPLQEIYLDIFPQEMSTYLRSKTTLPEKQEPPRSYPDAVKEFLVSFLHRQCPEQEMLPKELLPEVELSPLLDMNRQKFLEIIDLLAIHDLIDEVRHIVDKRILQSFLQHLSEAQQNYLRICLRQKAKTQTGTGSNIRELLKEDKKFSIQLHKRGLQRLAVALSGYDSDFIWHITHALDMQRAKFLLQYIRQEAIPNATRLTQLQVLHIIQFLKADNTL